MPTVRCSSSVRVQQDSATLRLDASHFLLVGERQSAPVNLKGPLPASVNVYSCSDLTITVSAVLDGSHLTGEEVKQSIISRHLVQLFRQNADQLGINNVSDAYIDQNDDEVKVNVTPRFSTPGHISDSRVALVSIHLTYKCTTIGMGSDVSRTSDRVPACNILNQALDKFITYHLVKRYPLIFGPWREKLERENTYFPSIANSILTMAHRSPNEKFRSQVRRHLKLLRKSLGLADRDAYNDLQSCCNGPDYDTSLDPDSVGPLNDEETIRLAMRRLYRLVLRPPLTRCELVPKSSLIQVSKEGISGSATNGTRDNSGPSPHLLVDNTEICYDSDENFQGLGQEGGAGLSRAMYCLPIHAPSPPSDTMYSWTDSTVRKPVTKTVYTDGPLVLSDSDASDNEILGDSTILSQCWGDASTDPSVGVWTGHYLEVDSDGSESGAGSLLDLLGEEDDGNSGYYTHKQELDTVDAYMLSSELRMSVDDLVSNTQTEISQPAAVAGISGDLVSGHECLPDASNITTQTRTKLLCFSGANHETDFVDDMFLPPEASVYTATTGGRVTSMSPGLAIDNALEDFLDSSLHPPVCRTNLMARPAELAVFSGDGAGAGGLDCEGEEKDEFDLYFGECDDKEGGEAISNFLYSQVQQRSAGSLGWNTADHGRRGHSEHRPKEEYEEDQLGMSSDDGLGLF